MPTAPQLDKESGSRAHTNTTGLTIMGCQHGITALGAHRPPAPKASGLPTWNHSAGRSPPPSPEGLWATNMESQRWALTQPERELVRAHRPCLREALGSNDQCHTCSTLRPPPPRAMGSKKQHIQRSTRITLRLQGALSSGSTPPPHPQGALGLKQQHKGLKAYIQPPIPSKSRPWHTPGS